MITIRKLKTGMLALLAILSLPHTAQAHHSYAMFDQGKEITAQAVIRTWQFTNPHATLWVYINDDQGKPVLWGIEAPGPRQLLQNGWDRETVKPGDEVSIVIHPLRDGRNGGSLVKLTLPGGRSLGTGGAPRAVEKATE